MTLMRVHIINWGLPIGGNISRKPYAGRSNKAFPVISNFAIFKSNIRPTRLAFTVVPQQPYALIAIKAIKKHAVGRR